MDTDKHGWGCETRLEALHGIETEVAPGRADLTGRADSGTQVREIEERSLNAWPALSRVFLDGWVVGLSEGYTRRANSVNPLYPGLLEPDRKVEMCEATYAERRLPTVFKMTPLAMEDGLDDLLALRDYEKVATTRVQTLTLDGAVSDVDDAEILEQSDGGWLADYGRIKRIGAPELRKTEAVLDRIGVGKRFVSIRVDGRRVAAGIAAVEGPLVGLLGSRPTLTIDVEGWGEG